ncbi:AI-2E family transporter [Paracoccus laeviglucosivorans]|uniref:Predicted PurR-regulated permease PerM n=1 Tax=Paracoccus laeviglucosivorans TaxID=1197861 RepID=A0A521FQU7_9RHOB|nr:AI-2E family transporter [Paracoccus laeviglucosivorans]SMO98569.1 Predicted PurR-regulated permease PerM [Paracoccus laeviglucosivorans]
MRERFGEGISATADARTLAAILVSIAVVLGLLYAGRDVLIPLAIAFLISFALSPLVRLLVRRHVPRPVAVSAVMALLLIILASLGLLIISQVGTLSQELPTYQSTIRNKIDGLADSLHKPGMFDGVLRTIDTVRKEVGEAVSNETDQDAPLSVEIIPDNTTPIKTAIAFLVPVLTPLATLGIVFVFVFLALLDQGDLRDRLLRILGGNLHRSTDAMEEAGRRISRYLIMQVIVNVTYAIPMALGLWLIGVPGFVLWGTLAALMRFVPYVGPILSAVFPLTLAFAVDDGWNMVLLTVTLIVVLELISSNIVEPILYGTSTGLSALSLIAAATFWTAMWGPVGLILSTPLTVCLLVLGRNVPQLQILETLLGSTPALDTGTRIYQRLIADDVEDAIELANETVEGSSLVEFYDTEGLAVLKRASANYLSSARPEHRLRIVNGMGLLLDDLREEFPGPITLRKTPFVACIGGKWEVDNVSAKMLVHCLEMSEIAAETRAAGVLTPHYLDKLDLTGVDVVCIAYLSESPERNARAFCQRLKDRWPMIKIVLGFWHLQESADVAQLARECGADHVVTSLGEATHRIETLLYPWIGKQRQLANRPPDDDARIAALRETDLLTGALREQLDSYAARAAEVFDVDFAVISAITDDDEFIVGQSAGVEDRAISSDGATIKISRRDAICDHVVEIGELLVVRDTHRDPRFSDHPTINSWKARFYAGAPIGTETGHVFGALCLLNTSAREFTNEERELLSRLAAEVSSLITGKVVNRGEENPDQNGEESSSTTAQLVPE